MNTHILPSQNLYFKHILKAAADGSWLDWTCPKSARRGDRVFFHLVKDGIVAYGTVVSTPIPSSEWNRRYAADIHKVHLLPTCISLETIQEEIPDLGWARYPRSYVTLSPGEARKLDEIISTSESLYSDVEAENRSYLEGAIRLVKVNAYERSLAARKAALKHHGAVCEVCKTDFGKTYGPQMAGFIHFHHLRPLNAISQRYRVNPKKDLVPLCPNCHAVVHSRRKPFSVPEVKAMYRRRAKKPI